MQYGWKFTALYGSLVQADVSNSFSIQGLPRVPLRTALRGPSICAFGTGASFRFRFRVTHNSGKLFKSVIIIMHRVARSLATAGCTKTTSAARLAAHSLRSASVVRPPARPAAAVGAFGVPSCRTIHVRVPLPYKIEDGLGDFLSPEALKVIAEDYQQGLLDRLNEQIKGALFYPGREWEATCFFLPSVIRKLTHNLGEGRYQV